jgi:hypothetical protein
MIAFFGTGNNIDDTSEYAFHLDNIAISTLAGMKEARKPETVNVYPNPSKGNFEVRIPGLAKPAILTLTTLTGQSIQTHQTKQSENSFQFKTAGLAPGIYLLKVASEEQVQVVKIIVQ